MPKDKETGSFQNNKMLTWAILAFIAYAAISGNLGKDKEAAKNGGVKTPAASGDLESEAREGLKKLSEVRIKTPEAEDKGISKIDITAGNGNEAACGADAEINYIASVAGGDPKNPRIVDSSYHAGQPVKFRIGAGQVIKGLELGVIGMKEGGARNITIPPGLGYDGNAKLESGKIPQGSTLLYEVKMLKVSSNTGASAAKIIDEAPGAESAAAKECGDKAKVKITAKRVSGAELGRMETETVIGDGKLMPVLEKAVSGMKPGGKRLVIAPPREIGRMDGVKFPKDEIALFEVELAEEQP